MLWLGHNALAILREWPLARHRTDERQVDRRTRRPRTRLPNLNFEPHAFAPAQPEPPDFPVSLTWTQGVSLAKPFSFDETGRNPNCSRKRIFDVVISLIALLMLLPLLVIVAIAVTLDSPGPILFRQSRGGLNGRHFQILKFRTMTCMEDGANVLQAKRDDVRVTRVGRVLRRTSIDELPQLFNVMRGDMSLVGPRPHAIAHDAIYANQIAAYSARQSVRPGITGWAQVNGCRGETRDLAAMERRISCDLEYIEHWSLWLDVRIVMMTMKEVVSPRNAY